MNIYHFRANGRPVIVRILVTGVKFEYRMVRKVHRNVFSCQIMQYEPDYIHLVKQFVTSSIPWRPSWIFFVRASCGPRKSRRKLLWVSVGPRLPSCKFSETCPQTPIRTYFDKFLSSYLESSNFFSFFFEAQQIRIPAHSILLVIRMLSFFCMVTWILNLSIKTQGGYKYREKN